MTNPGQHRVHAPRPQAAPTIAAAKSQPSRVVAEHQQQHPHHSPRLSHPPFSKNLRWTAVTLVRSLVSVSPPIRPCRLVADHVAAAALRDMRRRFPHRDLAAVERNARRRVYDAVKVMSAVGSVHKFRKKLKWLGVQHLVADAPQLRLMLAQKSASVKRKRVALQNVVRAVSHFRLFLSPQLRRSRALCSNRCRRYYFPFVLLKCHALPKLTSSPDRTRLSLHMQNPFCLYSETDLMAMLHSLSYPIHNVCVSPTQQPQLSLLPSSSHEPQPSPHRVQARAQLPHKPLIMMRLRDHAVQPKQHCPSSSTHLPPKKRQLLPAMSPPSPQLQLCASSSKCAVLADDHALHLGDTDDESRHASACVPSVKLRLRVRQHNEPSHALTVRSHAAHASNAAPCAEKKPLHQHPRVPIDRRSIWAAIVDEVATDTSPPPTNLPGSRSASRHAVMKNDRDFRHPTHTARRADVESNPTAMELMEEDLFQSINRPHSHAPQQPHGQHEQHEQHTAQQVDLMCYEELDLESLPDVTDQQRVRRMASPPLFSSPPSLAPLSNHTDLNDEQLAGDGSDALPFGVAAEEDENLLDLDMDMEMDSDPCLSDGVP
eukprot:TRINITY_DN225_c1_g1_i1.p2 TRINITY_DN225_c1_g1~~TRINITY_DN225_c1_g1_i1.p2  ORF type:complete len:615 (+),score=141.42 TRINITY_DN225_c1_g1_i1:46-1845(+)